MAKHLIGDILGVPIYVETDLPPTYFYFDYSLACLREKRLEVVAIAAQAIVDNEGGCASGGWREGGAFLRLAETVDAWLVLEKAGKA